MKAVELQGLTRRFKDKLAVDPLNLSLEKASSVIKSTIRE